MSTIFPFVHEIGYITGVIGTHPMELISGFQMMLSLHFGRFFWLDDDDDFCSCPAFEDGTADLDMWDYVSEWQDLEGVDLDKLFYIHRQLVLDKASVIAATLPTGL